MLEKRKSEQVHFNPQKRLKTCQISNLKRSLDSCFEPTSKRQCIHPVNTAHSESIEPDLNFELSNQVDFRKIPSVQVVDLILYDYGRQVVLFKDSQKGRFCSNDLANENDGRENDGQEMDLD